MPRRWIAVALVALIVPAAAAQEREVPKDSERISIPGCARGRVFVVAEPASYEPVTEVATGQRFRLTGRKALLDEIAARGRAMVEITGLVRKSQRRGPGGVSVAGGRIRIGGAMPQAPTADPSRDPSYNQVAIDVESWRPLPDACPAR